MKIDVSEPERNAAVLLSNTTAYILNQFGSLQADLENLANINVELEKQNTKLREKIKSLEESNSSDPPLSVK